MFNGSVVVSQAGKEIFSDEYGFSNIENQEKINARSQFSIASVTKTFTATAVLQLKQKGKLKIEDPVQKYLPDFPYSNKMYQKSLELNPENTNAKEVMKKMDGISKT